MSASAAPLPAFSPPTVPPTRPPSPPPPASRTAHGLILPLGCELVVRSPKPQDRTTADIVKQAIVDMAAQDPALARIPLVVSSKERSSTSCHVQLGSDDAIPDRTRSPRPDLLNLIMEPLRQLLPGWTVDWAPVNKLKDRATWVRAVSSLSVPKEEGIRYSDMVKKAVTEKGYTVLSAFYMAPDSCALILSTTAEAQALGDVALSLDTNPPCHITLIPFRQIQPCYAFELVIGGLDAVDAALLKETLDGFFAHSFARDGVQGFHASRVVDGRYYCLLLRDWAFTVDVLNARDAFQSSFGIYNLTHPILIYEANTNLQVLNPPRARTNQAIHTAGSELGALSARMTQMERTMKEGLAAQAAESQAIRTDIAALTGTINAVAGQVHNNSLALLAMRDEAQLKDKTHMLDMLIMQKQLSIARAGTQEKRAQLELELQKLESRLVAEQARAQSASAGVMQLLVSGPASQPTSRAAHAQAITPTASPAASPTKRTTAMTAKTPGKPRKKTKLAQEVLAQSQSSLQDGLEVTSQSESLSFEEEDTDMADAREITQELTTEKASGSG